MSCLSKRTTASNSTTYMRSPSCLCYYILYCNARCKHRQRHCFVLKCYPPRWGSQACLSGFAFLFFVCLAAALPALFFLFQCHKESCKIMSTVISLSLLLVLPPKIFSNLNFAPFRFALKGLSSNLPTSQPCHNASNLISVVDTRYIHSYNQIAKPKMRRDRKKLLSNHLLRSEFSF